MKIYLCLKEGAIVRSPQVCVKDVATVYCRKSAECQQIRQLLLFDFSKDDHTVTALTALFVMKKIWEKIPEADITNMGATELVVELVKDRWQPILTFLKMGFVSLVLFFGGAFSMMSFHTDVGLRDTFARLYFQLTGEAKPPVTILEVSYSLGVCIGIIVFFNHIGSKKVTHDPTPIQVQMRQYEKNVEQTFLAASDRKGRSKDV